MCCCYRWFLHLLFSTLCIAGTSDASTKAVVAASDALKTRLNQSLDFPLSIPHLGACIGAVVAELFLNAAEKAVNFFFRMSTPFFRVFEFKDTYTSCTSILTIKDFNFKMVFCN